MESLAPGLLSHGLWPPSSCSSSSPFSSQQSLLSNPFSSSRTPSWRTHSTHRSPQQAELLWVSENELTHKFSSAFCRDSCFSFFRSSWMAGSSQNRGRYEWRAAVSKKDSNDLNVTCEKSDFAKNRSGFCPSIFTTSLGIWSSQEGKRQQWRAAAKGPKVPKVPEVFDHGKNTETEEEARRRNWKEMGWAPWEEMRTPEAQFAVDSVLEAGASEPELSKEVFEQLDHKTYYERLWKRLEEKAKREEEEVLKTVNYEESIRTKPLLYTLTPPRDWPPPGWKVDAKELAFIRSAHSLEPLKVDKDIKKWKVHTEEKKYGLPRWEMFLKQYDEWVAANKDIMEQEALEVDEEYYHGRRRTGNKYGDGMYELPFIYPGQHYFGVVTCVSLYEGAFVYFGGVHDGWIPIMDNDWYKIRKYIKVGMKVHVEVIAKRDPRRFRFPIEMRFVDPCIDHLIFRRFTHPPIFGRAEDENFDEVSREADRPFFPKLRPEAKPEQKQARAHPYIRRLFMVHEAEKLELDAEEGIEQDGDDWDFPEEDDPDGEFTYEPGFVHQSIEGLEVPMIIVRIEDKYLDLDAARVERAEFKKLAAEAHARGEEFEKPEDRFEKRMKELNDQHQQRWLEQKEAVLRDRTCRLELGFPLEEPGRYADKTFWGKNPYDPREPQWRNDYWGDPSKINEDVRKDRLPKSKNEPIAIVNDQREIVFGDEASVTDDVAIVVESDRRVSVQRRPSEADMKLIFGDSDDSDMADVEFSPTPPESEMSQWKGLENISLQFIVKK